MNPTPPPRIPPAARGITEAASGLLDEVMENPALTHEERMERLGVAQCLWLQALWSIRPRQESKASDPHRW